MKHSKHFEGQTENLKTPVNRSDDNNYAGDTQSIYLIRELCHHRTGVSESVCTENPLNPITTDFSVSRDKKALLTLMG